MLLRLDEHSCAKEASSTQLCFRSTAGSGCPHKFEPAVTSVSNVAIDYSASVMISTRLKFYRLHKSYVTCSPHMTCQSNCNEIEIDHPTVCQMHQISVHITETEPAACDALHSAQPAAAELPASVESRSALIWCRTAASSRVAATETLPEIYI